MMKPYYQDDAVTIFCCDCRDVLPHIGPVDAVVTDPPYGLRFMGKAWDYDVPDADLWRLVLEACKPGAHLLSFAGTRTQHRMAVNIEDAGFEIRDMIAWVYGSGFPKSLDVSKAIDKAEGAERDVVGFDAEKAKQQTRAVGTAAYGDYAGNAGAITAPATDAAKQWVGWGTALKPALEPITVARKPFRVPVAANVLEYGTGAINIDGCRIESGGTHGSARSAGQGAGHGAHEGHGKYHGVGGVVMPPHPAGRWPSNLCHDGSDEVVGLFPVTGPSKAANRGLQHSGRHGGLADVGGNIKEGTDTVRGHDDAGGSAARFFKCCPMDDDEADVKRLVYCAKASKEDRDEGLQEQTDRILARSCQAQAEAARGNVVDQAGGAFNAARIRKNNHPTVKPTELMRYLCRLVTPPGGVILDPFMGSGSTGKAAILEGFRFIGVERDEEFCKIAVARIKAARRMVATAMAQEVLPLF